mmetsp:Transcript_6995/g.24319  ORF Transcript_6995/g.24319 Transcript_6995/m.24319 type:complete len:229 (+) Transcript_6995:43-729(+)
MDADAEGLPILPDVLVERIAVISTHNWLEWARTWRQVSRQFRDQAWYDEHLGFPVTMVPSATCKTVAQGLREASSTGGGRVVLVKPGVYNENLRVTADLTVIGWGPRGKVVVEGAGYEPALVFAGLGMSRQQAEILGVAYGDTGEHAVVRNITISGVNAEQAFVIYMQSGQACVTRCDIQGGVWIGGRGANPEISCNRIYGSRNCGVKVTDHAQGQIKHNTIEGWDPL